MKAAKYCYSAALRKIRSFGGRVGFEPNLALPEPILRYRFVLLTVTLLLGFSPDIVKPSPTTIFVRSISFPPASSKSEIISFNISSPWERSFVESRFSKQSTEKQIRTKNYTVKTQKLRCSIQRKEFAKVS